MHILSKSKWTFRKFQENGNGSSQYSGASLVPERFFCAPRPLQWTELSAKLLRREPLVVVGGRFILLLLEQQLPSRGLLRAVPKHKKHSIKRKSRRRGTPVEFWSRQGMRITFLSFRACSPRKLESS